LPSSSAKAFPDRRRKTLVALADTRRKVIMEVPVGKCLNCGKMINMWRCGDVTGGGTYHIVCFECNERTSRQSVQLTAVWRWVIGGIFVTAFIIGTFFVLLVFGGI
jgi:hypothetical protein